MSDLTLALAVEAARVDERARLLRELTSEGAEGIVLMQLDTLCDSPMLVDAERICDALASLLAPEGENGGVMPNMREEDGDPQAGHNEAPASSSGDEREAVPFTVTERGFRHYEPIPTGYGHLVSVYESSAADEPCVWLGIDARGATAGPGGTLEAHMRDQDAEILIRTLRFALDGHYQRRSGPSPSVGKEGGGRPWTAERVEAETLRPKPRIRHYDPDNPWSVGDRLEYVTSDAEITDLYDLDGSTATVLDVGDGRSILVQSDHGRRWDDPYCFIQRVPARSEVDGDR